MLGTDRSGAVGDNVIVDLSSFVAIVSADRPTHWSYIWTGIGGQRAVAV